MASSSNQPTDRGREKTAAAEGETIWELGPVRSRMTQNALGDNFVDQFQDNSEKEPSTAFGDTESNVNRSQIPTVKIEPENKSESCFSDYFKKTYNGSSNRITRTVDTFPDQNLSAATRLVRGELAGLNDQNNWEIMRGMRGGCDRMEGIRPGSNASSSGMRGPSDAMQSRADQFSFRMGLLERENVRPMSTFQGDISIPMSDLAGQMTLEEIERQKQKTLMNLHQLEQAQNVRQRMELEVKKRCEAMAKAREEDEMMKLIEGEQLKQAMVNQNLTRQNEDSGMGRRQQEDIDRLQKEIDMLKKQMSSKSPDNSAVKANSVPARSGVKYRLGVTARLGDPQELKKKVFERLGQDDEMRLNQDDEMEEYLGEFGDTQHGYGETRWKRRSGDKDSTLKNEYFKKRKNDSHELPADLVLTELSDAGPVPAKAKGAISRELVLTEFGENGPVKVQTELEKLEARTRKISKNN